MAIKDYLYETDFTLLEELVPDFNERYKTASKELKDEIRRRAIISDRGWKPLEWWKGCL